MTFALRFFIVTLAAFGFASIVTSIGVWWTMRRRQTANLDAAAIFQLRMAPVAMSLVMLALATASFEQFEPRGGEERTGLLLTLCAALSAAALATTIVRLVRMARASNRALAGWMTSAAPIAVPGLTIPAYRITSTFPIVAVAGLFRPRLLIAESVLAACPPDELDAILAHERWHVRNGDNLRRLLMAIVPDPLMWTRRSRSLMALWQSAAEDAADAEAALAGPAARVSLAAALIRIGRMAPAGPMPVDLPASALFRGENLDRRVRRLVDPPPDFATRRTSSTWLTVAPVSLLVVSLFALEPFHELVEAAVAFLP